MTFDITPYRSMYPFSSNEVEIKGHKYHYLDEGQGETLLLLHGNPTWSFYYREVIKALRDRYRVIVPDHIGCGLSDKPSSDDYPYTLDRRVDDVEALMEHLGLTEDITLIAHDWGGLIAAGYAIRHTSKIRRMVMLNTSFFMLPEGKGLPWRLWLLRMFRPFATFAVQGFNVFSKAATFMTTQKPLPAEVKKAYLAPYDSWANRIAVLRFVQDIPLVEGDTSYETCKFVQEHLDRFEDIPLMVCWGEHDFVFDMDFFAEWKRRFPNAEFHTFPDAGHYILEDVHEKVIPLIEDFLVKHPISLAVTEESSHGAASHT